MKKIEWILLLLVLVGMFASCSSAKFLEEGEYLLNKNKVECTDDRVDDSMLSEYIKQKPNTRWVWLFKVPLGFHLLSGKEGSSWVSRTLRKMGEEPVVYDRKMAERSCDELRLVLQNMGYLGASVEVDEKFKKHKVALTYRLNPGKVYRVDSVRMDIADTVIARKLQPVMEASLLKPDMVFDINVLDKERERIAEYLKESGYYKFNKNYINYTADTIQGGKGVALTMHLDLYQADKHTEPTVHPVYTIDSVSVVTEYDASYVSEHRLGEFQKDSYGGLDIYFQESSILRPSVYAENNYLREGELYRASDMQRTYSSLGRLGALKYTNVHLVEVPDSNKLNAYLMVSPSQLQALTLEVDGTSTMGDFGCAGSVAYQHKNLFKGSETFTAKVRLAYEALSGIQEYETNSYTDLGFELTLNFPRLLFPRLSSEFKRRVRASSEVGMNYNIQDRPEFSRRALSASWRYRWNSRQNLQSRLDLLDVNYVYMPSISPTFRDEYLNSVVSNSILKYNYDDLFIVRTGYSFSYASADAMERRSRSNYSINANVESAGLLCSLLSHVFFPGEHSPNGQYSLWNIAYAQYLKGDLNYVRNLVVNERTSFAFHVGFGIAWPYGNSSVLPFEKRYFAGGANSVRGWSVRSLGPGSFSGGDRRIDFINQTGDLKLDMSAEWRTVLGGIFCGAFFVDAGNIWTLREYEEQPGGAFHFDSFWKEIAVAYGIGFRLDLNFIVARLDLGMKAVNPAYSIDDKRHYPIIRPRWKRDRSFHLAVGYPF